MRYEMKNVEITVEGRKVGTATVMIDREDCLITKMVPNSFKAEIEDIQPPWLAKAFRTTCDEYISTENRKSRGR